MNNLKIELKYYKDNQSIFEQGIILNSGETLSLKLPIKITVGDINIKAIELIPDEIRFKIVE